MTQKKQEEKRIPDEKRLEYVEAKRIKEVTERKKRKEEKIQGKMQDRLLAFLENLIKSHGYNHRTFAEKANTTAQSIYWIFSVKDDCDLTKVEEFLNVLDYDVRLELREVNKSAPKRKLDRTSFQSRDISIKIEGDIMTSVGKNNNYPTPEYIKNYPEDGRLHALAELICRDGYTLKEFSEITGIPAYTVRLIFTRDNIRVSQIAEIAKAFGLEIVWKLSKK